MKIALRPFSKMVPDMNVQDLSEGRYVSALGVRNFSVKRGKNNVTTPVPGTLYAFTPPEPVVQNKTYELRLLSDGQDSSEIFSFSIVRNTSLVPIIPEIEFSYASAAAQISQTASSFGYPFTVTQNGPVINIIPNNPFFESYDYEVIPLTGNIAVDITNEPVDVSLAKPLRGIQGHNDLNDLFWLSCSVKDPISSIVYSSIQLTGGEVIVTAPLHGLVSGQEVLFEGFPTLPSLNGRHIVNVISPNVFVPIQAITVGFVTPGEGNVYKNHASIFELGVGLRNQPGQWNYTRLLRTSKIPASRLYKPRFFTSRLGDRVFMYWTDYNDRPRRIEYKGPWIADGVLKTPGYKLISIADNTLWQSPPSSMKISNARPAKFAGAVLSGNWRFVARGSFGDTNISSSFGAVSGPVSVFSSDEAGNPAAISGDREGIVTNKAVEITVSDVNPNLFEYVELVGIQYQGLSVATYLVARIKTQPGQFVYEYLFTGNESDLSVVDAISINVEDPVVLKARDAVSLSNRAVLASVSYYPDSEEIQKFVDTGKYSIEYKQIPDSGRYSQYRNGSFNSTENIFKYGHFMIYETYAIAIRLRWRFGGGYTKSYPFAKVKIDTQATSSDGKRISGLPHYQIYDGFSNLINIPFLNVFGFDDSVLFDGKPISYWFDQLEVMIGDMPFKSVLASGIGVRHVITSFPINPNSVEVDNRILNSLTAQFDDTGSSYLQLPFPIGALGDMATCPDIRFALDLPVNFDQAVDKKGFSFYSADSDLRQVDLKGLQGAKLVIIGYYKQGDMHEGVDSSSVVEDDRFKSKHVTLIDRQWTVVEEYDIQSSEGLLSDAFSVLKYRPLDSLLSPLQDVVLSRNFGHSVIGASPFFSGPIFTNGPSCFFTTAQPMDSINSGTWDNNNLSVFRALIVVDNENQYPDQEGLISYYSSGATISISNLFAAQQAATVEVFGGDTVVSHSHRRVASAVTPAEIWARGGYLSVSFYGQSRANEYMRSFDEDADGTVFPNADIALKDWHEDLNPDQLFYNPSYTISNIVQKKPAYDPSFDSVNDLTSRLAYTPIKIENGVIDSFRKFLANDYHDMSAVYGPISGIYVLNEVLYARTSNGFFRHFFNTYGTVTTDTGIENFIGDGQVLSRPSDRITEYGGNTQWPFCIGKSPGGDDVLYYIDAVRKVLVRFGADGVVDHAMRSGYSTEIFDLCKYAEFFDAPSAGSGIHMVWNQSLLEVIIFFKMRTPNVIEWGTRRAYNKGSLVALPGENEVYRAKSNIVSFSFNDKKPPNSVWWELVPFTDTDVYQYKTLVVSEKADGLSHELPFITDLAVAFKNTYVSLSPDNQSADVYENEAGFPLVFYEDKVDPQVPGNIKFVFNAEKDVKKIFNSLIFSCDVKPFAVDVETKRHKTTLDLSMMEQESDLWVCPIGNDITLGGDSDGTGSALFGEYCVVTFYFEPGVDQTFIQAFLRFSPVDPMPGV